MKCERCKKPRGKRNPKKSGWHTISVGGRARPLCPGCTAEWVEAAEIHNKQMLQWLQGSRKFYETK